ncbi:MAG: hypothetical protein ABR878_07510 [Roseiarcus sp.]
MWRFNDEGWMLHFPAMRMFGLRPEGVHCGRDGLFVGSVPLLRQERDSFGREFWSVRPAEELDNELTARYGSPIDVAAKAGGLASVARALDRGDLALAGIAAVLLQFPDPPPLEKGAPAVDDWAKLAAELARSGLLKGDWDPSKHPRTGEKPNPGWFAQVVREVREVTSRMRAWPSPRFNKALRDLVEAVAEKGGLSEFGPYADATAIIWELVDQLGPSELNDGEQRAIEQTNAYFDPPKTLEELQTPPAQNGLGYERHHIVEQNDDNVAKTPFAKFGRATIDDPSNIVYIARLKHELITADFNSEVPVGSQGQTLRDLVDDLDFDDQRSFGLYMLRRYGILQ